MEFDEAGHLVEAGLARGPDKLEGLLFPLDDLETIHCNEHGFSFVMWLVVALRERRHLSPHARQAEGSPLEVIPDAAQHEMMRRRSGIRPPAPGSRVCIASLRAAKRTG